METDSAQYTTWNFEESIVPIRWPNTVSLQDYVNQAFTQQQANHNGTTIFTPSQLALPSAVKREKTAEIKMQATNALSSHLSLDATRKILQVFDCTAALKETLAAAYSDSEPSILPRSLLLEVLRTIHYILFPSDKHSLAFLKKLVDRNVLDKDLQYYVFAQYQREDDETTEYIYLKPRLTKLFQELENHTPHTRFEEWFERKSGPRYMIIATMIGVFLTVILGIPSLGVSAFQTWVSC